MVNVQLSKRERLTYAAQALATFYFEHRSHPLAARVLAKHDDVLGIIDAWYRGQQEWMRAR